MASGIYGETTLTGGNESTAPRIYIQHARLRREGEIRAMATAFVAATARIAVI